MVKKFIILVDEDFNKEQRNAITNFFKGKYAYWHWIGNVWLITTKNETDTVNTIRDELIKLTNRGAILVINASESSGWAAFGQKKKFTWMHNSWSKKPESFPESEDKF
ncbi:hypothetical protein BKK50_11185 [Rodentibacter rarus]|uniref:Uncharacterized protein n=1 Tax=Rodentibacter rarus TaxID=1908260 RepID=A0A1V3IFB4_9PAST|nr:hypothetical protein [Rodentibacter rarus]OOF38986.1 hypothetical protein BKK50_11185 [Rodentibacter rarus]